MKCICGTHYAQQLSIGNMIRIMFDDTHCIQQLSSGNYMWDTLYSTTTLRKCVCDTSWKLEKLFRKWKCLFYYEIQGFTIVTTQAHKFVTTVTVQLSVFSYSLSSSSSIFMARYLSTGATLPLPFYNISLLRSYLHVPLIGTQWRIGS